MSSHYEAVKDFIGSPKVALVACLTTGAALFLPAKILEALKIEGAATTLYPYIGGVFLLSVVVLFVQLSAIALRRATTESEKAKAKRQKAELSAYIDESIASFTPREGAVIGFCHAKGQSVVTLPLCGTTRSPCQRPIMSQIQSGALDGTFGIPPEIFAELRKRPLSAIVGPDEAKFTKSMEFCSLEMAQVAPAYGVGFLED